MTMITVILDVLLAAAAVAMYMGGQYGVTKQLALVPALVALLDASLVPQVTPELTMVLSVIGILLQAVVFISGAAVLYEDRVRARNKSRRRQRRREVAARRAALACVGEVKRPASRICA